MNDPTYEELVKTEGGRTPAPVPLAIRAMKPGDVFRVPDGAYASPASVSRLVYRVAKASGRAGEFGARLRDGVMYVIRYTAEDMATREKTK